MSPNFSAGARSESRSGRRVYRPFGERDMRMKSVRSGGRESHAERRHASVENRMRSHAERRLASIITCESPDDVARTNIDALDSEADLFVFH